MNNNFEQFKDALRQMRMTDNEAHTVRARLLRFIDEHTGEAPSIESPYVRHSFILKPLQMVALALVLVLSGGSGLAFASKSALPGDALYGFKVNVAEEVVAFTQRGSEAKAQYAIDRAATRLEETTELVLAGRLDETAKESISRHITSHTQEARKHTKGTGSSLQTELALATRLESSLQPRTELLKGIGEEQSINGELGTILAVTEENIEIAKLDKEEVVAELSKTETETTKADIVLAKLGEVNKHLNTLTVLAPEEEPKKILVDDTEGEETIEIVFLVEKETLSLIEQRDAIRLLVIEAEIKIDEGKYSEALVLLQEAESRVASTLTLIDLKETFKLQSEEASTEKESLKTTTEEVSSTTGELENSVQTEGTTPQES